MNSRSQASSTGWLCSATAARQVLAVIGSVMPPADRRRAEENGSEGPHPAGPSHNPVRCRRNLKLTCSAPGSVTVLGLLVDIAARGRADGRISVSYLLRPFIPNGRRYSRLESSARQRSLRRNGSCGCEGV